MRARTWRPVLGAARRTNNRWDALSAKVTDRWAHVFGTGIHAAAVEQEPRAATPAYKPLAFLAVVGALALGRTIAVNSAVLAKVVVDTKLTTPDIVGSVLASPGRALCAASAAVHEEPFIAFRAITAGAINLAGTAALG